MVIEKVLKQIEAYELSIFNKNEEIKTNHQKIEYFQNLMNNITFDSKNLSKFHFEIYRAYESIDLLEYQIKSDEYMLKDYYKDLEDAVTQEEQDEQIENEYQRILSNLDSNLKLIKGTFEKNFVIRLIDTNRIAIQKYRNNHNLYIVAKILDDNSIQLESGKINLNVKRVNTAIRQIDMFLKK